MHILDAGATIFRGISSKKFTNCHKNSGQRLLLSKGNYRPNTRQSGPSKSIYIKYLKIYFLIVLDKNSGRSAATPSFWLHRSTRRKQCKMKTPSIPGPGTAFLNFSSAVKLFKAWKTGIKITIKKNKGTKYRRQFIYNTIIEIVGKL